MRVITLNCNGIRSAVRKGLLEWLDSASADVVCLQETKAQEHQLKHDLFAPLGYHVYYHDAEKKGYSGVAVLSRTPPQRTVPGMGWPAIDAEGRFLQVDFTAVSVMSLYLPSGSSSEARQEVKFDVMRRLTPVLRSLRRKRHEFILCGDWNIAHTKRDIKNWRGNQKNSGFLPEERAWLDEVFDSIGLVDAFRVLNQQDDQYTWWSNRGQAWAKNVGWRIDYQVITPGLRDRVRAVSIYKAQRFSDHAPLIVDYDLDV